MAEVTDDSRAPRDRPTMKDVAALAGVGLSTVSRVVGGEGGVKPAKVDAVVRAVAKLGYTRNSFGRQLRTGRASSIGVLVPHVADPFFALVVDAIESVAADQETLLVAASSTNDGSTGLMALEQFRARRLDGLIIVPMEDVDLTMLAHEIDYGVPIVFIDRPPRGIEADDVTVDNAEGASHAIAHLVDHGHRRIACFAHVTGKFTSEHRQQGYRDALARAGIDVDPGLLVALRPNVDQCVNALRAMAADPHPPTAVFATTRSMTLAVLSALRLLEFRPAFVGFDDFEFASLMNPPTTVIAQDAGSIGRIAADMLYERMGGYRGPARHVVLDTTLIARGSGEIRAEDVVALTA